MSNKLDDFMKDQGITLEHYGVKGMKWGVDKSESGGGSSETTSLKTDRSGKVVGQKPTGKSQTNASFETVQGPAGGVAGLIEEEDLTEEEIEERERMAAALLGIDIEKFKEYTGDNKLRAEFLKGAEWTDDRDSFMFKAADKIAEVTGDKRPSLQRNVENHVGARKFLKNIFDKPSKYQDKRVTFNYDATDDAMSKKMINDVLRGGGTVSIDKDRNKVRRVDRKDN